MKKELEKPFDTGDFIKHEQSMDVALQIDYAYDQGDGILVTGYWWNQGYEKSWLIPYKDPNKRRNNYGGGYGPDTQTFLIKKADLGKWLKIKMPMRSSCLRKCEWRTVA